jgi:CBS-domain-containing membrane protein
LTIKSNNLFENNLPMALGATAMMVSREVGVLTLNECLHPPGSASSKSVARLAQTQEEMTGGSTIVANDN